MLRKYLKLATLTLTCFAVLGTVFATLSILSMRVARHRAYAEIAADCSRISVVTFQNTRFFCAPVARIEGMSADPAGGEATIGTLL